MNSSNLHIVGSVVQAEVQAQASIFLEGPVGSGKTRTAVQRLKMLLDAGVSPLSVLVVTRDRTMGSRFRAMLAEEHISGPVKCVSFFNLAINSVQDFWPHIALEAGFGKPAEAPQFLNFETAQFAMRRVIQPLLDQGFFANLTIRPQRILSELLDNLNKAAVNGHPIEEVGVRLAEAWPGDPGRTLDFQHAQQCIDRFRRYTLRNNVLDFSLTIDSFNRHLVHHPTYWRYFTEQYRHLIFDNFEESVPVAQTFARRFIDACDSTLLIYDRNAGYRTFLGVDPAGAYQVKSHCREHFVLAESTTSNPDAEALSALVGSMLGQEVRPGKREAARSAVKGYLTTRFRSELIQQVADTVSGLIQQGVPAGQIALVAPIIDGVLRFSLGEAMERKGIPFRVVRRYESLREEPVVRTGLTLLVLVHPEWKVSIPEYDVMELLTSTIPALDPIRAMLIVRNLFDPTGQELLPPETLSGYLHERIGFAALEKYEAFLHWLQDQRNSPDEAVDHTLRSYFNSVLASPGFPPDVAGRYNRLIKSMAQFREVAPYLDIETAQVGRHYVEMIMEGTVAAQYQSLNDEAEDNKSAEAILAPIHTFLLSGRTVAYQFWLDVADMGWWQPLYQPLTNPHVLSEQWKEGATWSDRIDVKIRDETLFRLVNGLCYRCREGIYLCASEARMETQGDNRLMRILQDVLKGGVRGKV